MKIEKFDEALVSARWRADCFSATRYGQWKHMKANKMSYKKK